MIIQAPTAWAVTQEKQPKDLRVLFYLSSHSATVQMHIFSVENVKHHTVSLFGQWFLLPNLKLRHSVKNIGTVTKKEKLDHDHVTTWLGHSATSKRSYFCALLQGLFLYLQLNGYCMNCMSCLSDEFCFSLSWFHKFLILLHAWPSSTIPAEVLAKTFERWQIMTWTISYLEKDWHWAPWLVL